MRVAFGVVAFLSLSVAVDLGFGLGLAEAQPCSVNIAHAPDDVREIVEHWVAGESRCRPDLEVRIVPTDGGYYLFARDGSGQVRERIVPDAQSAGVLVASWVADDGVVAAADPTETPPPGVEMPPGRVSPAETPSNVVVAAPSPERASPVHLQVGAMIGELVGARVDLDTTRRGRFIFGLAISGDAAKAYDANYDGLTLRDLSGVVYVASVFHKGPVWLRGQLGAGVITSEFNAALWNGSTVMDQTGGDTSAMFEGVVRLGVDLGAWSLSAGPVGRVYHQQWISGDQFMVERQGDVSVYLGVGRRL